MRVARIATLAAIAALAGCGGASMRHAPAPPPAPRLGDFVGIYADDVFFGDDAYKRDALARQRRAGIGLIRQPFAWAQFAGSPKPYDDFVAAAARAGIRVLPVVLGPEPDAPKGDGGMVPPRNLDGFERFAAALVRRYGPDGSLWTKRPDVPKLPVGSWQIWNEPNISAFWATGPDPAAYARLLEGAAGAIRAVDPHAEIVTAGLPTSHLGIPAARFLEGVYGAGARGSFDVVAVHAYAPTPARVVGLAEQARRIVGDNGDDAKLWVTEFGWGTGGKPGPLTVSPDEQARNLAETLRELTAKRRALDLRGVVVFQWRDPKPFPGRRDIWPYHAGLLTADGSRKPSLRALEDALAK